VYINLDKRTDRREEIETELAKCSLSGERFAAIERRPGIVGCGYSHLAVLKMAKERNLPEILILEDDFMLSVSPETFVANVETVMSIPFDVCMFAYNLHETHGNYLSPNVIDLKRVKYAQTASNYLVRSHYYDKLIELYEWAIPELEKTGMHWVYANDLVWKSLQENDLWVCTTERQGKQRPGYSDNAERITDHGV
jgi:GR25 family glycosyltransferase involved in LPS biosynthesis